MQITKITKVEYQKIEDVAVAAKDLMEDPRFAFVRDYLEESIIKAQELVLNNTLRDLQEVNVISATITRIFKTPKKVQVDELRGEFKFANRFLDFVRAKLGSKIELDEAIARKEVVIDE